MALLTAKSSTIFIAAAGEATRVYRSEEEIPAGLRRKLHASTSGVNSATILIADQGEPTQLKCRLADTIRAGQTESPKREGARRLPGSFRGWLELLAPVVIGAGLWFLIESRA